MDVTQLGSAAVLLWQSNEKQAAAATLSYSLKGTLYLSSSGFLLLSVPNDIGNGAFQALHEQGVEQPLGSSGRYNAHITVMRPEEVEQLGGPEKITERGKTFGFTLGPVREVDPAGWAEMSRCWFIEANSPELEKLRKSYGLPRLPEKNGDPMAFHITFAVRRRRVLHAGNDVVKGSVMHAPALTKSAAEKTIHHKTLVTETVTVVKELCPHCDEEIREKSIYIDDDGYEYHRPCKDKGPIGRPFTPEAIQRLIHPDLDGGSASDETKEGAGRCPGCKRPFRKDEPYPNVSQCEICERYGPPKKEKAAIDHGLLDILFDPAGGRVFLKTAQDSRERLATWHDAFNPFANVEMGEDDPPGEWLKLAMAGVEIKESPIDGKGLFATRSYEPGDVVVARAMSKLKGEDSLTRYEQSDESRFTNHSENPNVSLRKQEGYVELVAIRPISSGEELTGDYRHTSGALGPGFYFSYRNKRYNGESTSGQHLDKDGPKFSGSDQPDKQAADAVLIKQIAAARKQTAKPASEAQADAGNYRKGKVQLHGFTIALENPKGSIRSGTAPDGKKWSTKMVHDYGYIHRTEGNDGDHVDVFIGPHPESEIVYVVNQVDPSTKKFDEHKCCFGFMTQADAEEGYLANYEKGWQGVGSITPMTMVDFKKWLDEGDQTKKAASKRVFNRDRLNKLLERRGETDIPIGKVARAAIVAILQPEASRG